MTAYRIELAAGQELFREGDSPTSAFLIESGTLTISTMRNGGSVELGRLGAGMLLGEMAVIDDSPRTATATALTDCVLAPIDRNQLGERLEAADPVVRALLLSQLSRYRSALAQFSGAQSEQQGTSAASSSAAPFAAPADPALSKIRRENELREAIERRELEVRLQPIQRVVDCKVAGYEALTRWNRPDGTAVSPAEFISLAEETSLIVPVGDYVLGEVCAALAKLASRGVRPMPYIALNVSGRQLEDGEFIDRLISLAQAKAVDPTWIMVEITEGLVLDYAVVSRLIERCHRAKIRVALDDFGTGYSNLGHLRELEFDLIKLDQSFIRHMDQPRCLAIVRAVANMARALGCQVVAEGVETREQLALLEGLGCDFAQGFLFGGTKTVAEIVL